MGPLAALIPVALQYLPDLAKWVSGDTGEKVAERAVEVVKAVTGAETPEGAAAALADPGVAFELRITLARLANEQEANRETARTTRYQAMVADVANAREMTKAEPLIAKTQVGLAIGIWLTFAAVLLTVATGAVPGHVEGLFNVLLGLLGGAVSQVTQFFFGASTSSHSANSTLARMVRTQPQAEQSPLAR